MNSDGWLVVAPFEYNGEQITDADIAAKQPFTVDEIMSDNLNKSTPVIMLTANATRGARQEYINAGFTDYLTKPVKEESLQAMLKKYLDVNLYSKPDADHSKLDAQVNSNPVDSQSGKDRNVLQCLKEMAWMKSIGIKGIKVDFFGGDKQQLR